MAARLAFCAQLLWHLSTDAFTVRDRETTVLDKVNHDEGELVFRRLESDEDDEEDKAILGYAEDQEKVTAPEKVEETEHGSTEVGEDVAPRESKSQKGRGTKSKNTEVDKAISKKKDDIVHNHEEKAAQKVSSNMEAKAVETETSEKVSQLKKAEKVSRMEEDQKGPKVYTAEKSEKATQTKMKAEKVSKKGEKRVEVPEKEKSSREVSEEVDQDIEEIPRKSKSKQHKAKVEGNDDDEGALDEEDAKSEVEKMQPHKTGRMNIVKTTQKTKKATKSSSALVSRRRGGKKKKHAIEQEMLGPQKAEDLCANHAVTAEKAACYAMLKDCYNATNETTTVDADNLKPVCDFIFTDQCACSAENFFTITTGSFSLGLYQYFFQVSSMDLAASYNNATLTACSKKKMLTCGVSENSATTRGVNLFTLAFAAIMAIWGAAIVAA
ncbi:unnamed protein product [Amoebophrya sp. A25]|nr:unnamed protein product [Amoebophrya sp. A25]|eukprot:GSA25T00003709001.1